MSTLRTIAWTCLLAASLAAMATAQTVFQPLRHPVYEFLDRLETRYGHGMPDFVRPIARVDIARHLDALARSGVRLARHDREQLAFYAEEFAEELRRLRRTDTLVDVPSGQRWRLLQLRDASLSDAWFGVDLVARAGIDRRDGGAPDRVYRTGGVAASGYLSDVLGFGMRWTDNGMRGQRYDVRAARTPEQAAVRGPGSDMNYEYEVAEGQFTWSHRWVRLGFDKLDRWQGSGRDGSIILSDKVPSYPALTLQLRFADWFHFDYSHGWLFSDSLDLDRTQPFYAGFERQKIYAAKYYVTHALTVRPMPALQLVLGESIIYSDRIEPLFLIPVISFRAADRWTRASTGNSQLFADVRYTPIPGITVYGTGYIDELDVAKTISGDDIDADYHVAYTLGARATDLHAPLTGIASETRLEFSRVYPYVYANPKITQQYTSHQVGLGHWIGANADILTIEHVLHPLRALEVGGRVRYTRFGEGREFLPQPPRVQPAFLYDYEYSALQLDGRVVWHPWHDVIVAGEAGYTAIRTGPGYTGTPLHEGLTIGLRAGYGVF